MARRPRLVIPGVPMHVVQRGVDRQACFFTDADRRLYLTALEALAPIHDCAIHAYVLMTNHVHLLLTPSRPEAPSRLLQALGRRYVRHVNDAHQRSGTLWEGRFRSCVVGEERYLLACHRYIEMNPVRAGMVGTAAAYPWSSHNANVGAARSTLLQPHEVVLGLGTDETSRRAGYRALFDDGEDVATVEAIRRTTRSNYALGSRRFEEQITAMLGRRAAPGKPGRLRREAEETAH